MVFSNDFSLNGFEVHRIADIGKEYKATMTSDDFLEIYDSGGMSGVKYRKNMIAAIAKGLITHGSAMFVTASDSKKNFLITFACTMMGMWFGTTASKRTLVKNMGAYMETRTTQNDMMALTWKIMDTKFCTYVNGEDSTKVPSLKFPSCMADFCMLATCILLSQVYTGDEVRLLFLNADGTLKNYNTWDDLFKKQWIGNFDLDSAAQKEHKDWEEAFWEDDVKTTSNLGNRDFSVGFKKDFYKNTEGDDIQLWSHVYTRVTPSSVGYTMTDLANYIMAVSTLMRNSMATAVSTGDTAFEQFATNGIGIPLTPGSATVADYIKSAAFTGMAMGRVGEAAMFTVT